MFMAMAASVSPRVEEERYLALLRAANAIATCSDCSSASDKLSQGLREVTPFDWLHLVAFDKETNSPTWSLLEAHGKRLDVPEGREFSVEDSPIPLAHQSGQTVVTDDWSHEARFQKYGGFLAKL